MIQLSLMIMLSDQVETIKEETLKGKVITRA